MADPSKYRVLRTDLPVEVWDRLAAEAATHDMKIGAWVKHLLLNRDKRNQG